VNIFEIVVVQPIFNLLIGIYSLIPGGDFGVALIIFTILIRFALWPIVVRQLHQTKAMRKLQPELRRIKKESKGNRQLEGMKMLELYKKHDVKPFRSFLILLIQLPIFIGIYSVVQIFTLHRDQIGAYTYGFLEGVEPIRQLIANPEQFNEYLFGVVDLTAHAISSTGVNFWLIVIALIAVVTQYIISKQTMPAGSDKRLRDVMAEAGEGKQPDAAELNAVMMQKMVKVLPFIFFFVIIGLPGAIALYYAVSNIFAAIQQHYLLKKDTEELEEIAEEPVKTTGKKATAKAREKQAREATVTRIVAKDKPQR
jgi:YidC/Oxa1 family membrane protein insertase